MQYGYPNSDETPPNDWKIAGTGLTEYWEAIDDPAGNPNLTDYVYDETPRGESFRVGLSGVQDPVFHAGHRLVVLAKSYADLEDCWIRVRLMQGSKIIATRDSPDFATESWINVLATNGLLTEVEAARIDKYDELSLQIEAYAEQIPGGTGAEWVGIAQVYLEVPDVPIIITPGPTIVEVRVPGVTLDRPRILTPDPTVVEIRVPTIVATISPLTPDPVVVNIAVPTPTVVLGTVTITPDPVVVNVAVPAVTLEVPNRINPDPVVVEVAVPAPTLDLPRAITPDPVVVNVAVPSPAVNVPLTLTPDPVLLEVGVPSMTMAMGTLTLTPDPVIVGVAVPLVTVKRPNLLSPQPVVVEIGVPPITIALAGLTITPDPVVVEVSVPAVTLSTPKVLTPGPVVVELRTPLVYLDMGGLTLTPDPVIIEVAVPSPTLDLPRTLTPAPVVVEIAVPTITLSTPNRIAPDPVVVEVVVPSPTLGLPRTITPDPVVVNVAVPSPTLDVPRTFTPSATVVNINVPSITVSLGGLALAPDPVVVNVAVPSVTLYVPNRIYPDPVVVQVSVPAVTLGFNTILTPIPTVVTVRVLGVDVQLTGRWAARLIRPTYIPRARRPRPPATPRPGIYRGNYRLDGRGLYRVLNEPEYRFFHSVNGPPQESDAPFATSATLAHEPADAYADGRHYFAASYFAGVIDSGFLPLGPNGERYVRIDIVGGVAVGLPPLGPIDARLEVVSPAVYLVATYFQIPGTPRATEWAVAYTVDGSTPPESGVVGLLTYSIPSRGLAVLREQIYAWSAEPTEPVKVRVQTRYTDNGALRWSENSEVLSITADGTAPAASPVVDRWPGRLPEYV